VALVCDTALSTRGTRRGADLANLKKTALYGVHESLGAKMVDFAGFAMPVSYGSIIEEHMAVRERVGIFDVSHMGEFLVVGDGALDFINEVITNDCSMLTPGRLQYTVMCREDGTVVDDLLVFVLAPDRIMLVVNASNIDKDFEHISGFNRDGIELTDVSDDYALIAVQGPRTREVLTACALFDSVAQAIEDTPYYQGVTFEHEGSQILMSRTGYTGELGFEIFVPNKVAERFWREITQAGQPHGIGPIGLGARDTLRFEASLCLYGHELDDHTTPLEAGLQWLVKLKKKSFRGLDALRLEKEQGLKRKLVGFELDGRAIARQGYDITSDSEVVGRVTSGAFAPALKKSLCMGLVSSAAIEGNKQFEIQIRNKSVPAARTQLPFYASRAR
jgi:aminomethyltransferase